MMYEKLYLSDMVPVMENKKNTIFLQEKSVVWLFDSQLGQKIITRVVTWDNNWKEKQIGLDHCSGRYLPT